MKTKKKMKISSLLGGKDEKTERVERGGAKGANVYKPYKIPRK